MEICIDAALCDVFRALCQERGLTQDYIARRTGWSQSQVSHLWRGARKWKVHQLCGAARALDLEGGGAELLATAQRHAQQIPDTPPEA